MRHGTPFRYAPPSSIGRGNNGPSKPKSGPVFSKYQVKDKPSLKEKFLKESYSATQSDTSALVFPWDIQAECYKVEEQMQQVLSNGISLEMINALFKDITQSKMAVPFRDNGLFYLSIVSGVLGVALIITYVILGSTTSYYKYEILSDSDKRFIAKTEKSTTADIWIVVVGVLIILLAIVIGFLTEGSSWDEARLRIRGKLLLKIARRHESTTFANTGCKISPPRWVLFLQSKCRRH